MDALRQLTPHPRDGRHSVSSGSDVRKSPEVLEAVPLLGQRVLFRRAGAEELHRRKLEVVLLLASGAFLEGPENRYAGAGLERLGLLDNLFREGSVVDDNLTGGEGGTVVQF